MFQKPDMITFLSFIEPPGCITASTPIFANSSIPSGNGKKASDAATEFSHKFVVERATVADKKDQPKRLIITIIAAIGSFIFIVFSLLPCPKFFSFTPSGSSCSK